MTHTPAPWTTTIDYLPVEGECHWIWNADREIIANLYISPSKNIPVEEQRSNICVMTAAPDLLAACKAINEWCGTDDAAHALPFEPPWYEQLHAAIVKAKGDQS